MNDYTINDIITVSALYLSSIDGDIDEREISLIINDEFISKYFNNDSKDLFVKLKKEGLINEVLFTKTFRPVLLNQPKEIRNKFISSLVKIGYSDSYLDNDERDLITIISEACGLTPKEVGIIFENNLNNISNYNLGDAVIICAFCILLVGEDFDKSDLAIINNNTFFKKYYNEERLDKVLEIFKSKEKTLLQTIQNDFGFLRKEPLPFKKSLINGLIEVLISGRNIGKNEITVLDTIAGKVGFSSAEVDLLMLEMDNKLKKKASKQSKININQGANSKVQQKPNESENDIKELGKEFQDKFSGFAAEAKDFSAELKSKAMKTMDNKRIMVGILAIFLGQFGVHKFMLRYNKEGKIILITWIIGAILSCLGVGVFILFILVLVGIIEGIIYLIKSDEEFYNIYQKNKKNWF